MNKLFKQPKDVTDLDLVFPSVRGLMPEYEEIPEEFRNRNSGGWQRKLQRQWFFNGIQMEDIPEPKEGIDKANAIRHLACIQGSFEPKHEHKEAAVAYLFDLWFKPPK